MRKIILLGCVSFVLLICAGTFIVYRFAQAPGTTQHQEIIYEVGTTSFYSLANDLQTANVIQNSHYFYWLGRVLGYSQKIRRGEYQFFSDMTPLEVLKILASGKSLQHPLTIQEGLNIYEIANILEEKKISDRQSFLKKCFDRNFLKKQLDENLSSCEGYLFPETYFFPKNTGIEKILETMFKKFLQQYEIIEPQAKNLSLTRHQIVTFASIIEKETGSDDERALVSSVYHNRLTKNMMLQADPTVLYGLMDKTKSLQMNISRHDLHSPTLYNTYTMRGLPFGPIANPGLKSLQAAVQPAPSEFLYFVSRNDGTHVFSKDYKDHSAAVDNFQKDPKAREGKSWRNLKKKTK